MAHPFLARFGRWQLTTSLLSLALLAACGGGGDDDGAGLQIVGYGDDPASYEAGVNIEPNQPSFVGLATSWSVNPALPSGLDLDPLTGIISGMPLEVASLGVYVVTAANDTESDAVELAVEVVPIAPGFHVVASRSSEGVNGTNASNQVALSTDGLRAAFVSFATNLVAGDTNFQSDVFLHDLTTEQTLRVSVSSSGEQANQASNGGALDVTAEYVVYQSDANNLVPNDTNFRGDVFRTRVGADFTVTETIRVSVSSAGVEGNDSSVNPSIAGQPAFVVFSSAATNLVDGDTNGRDDVFLRQILSPSHGTTVRVSLTHAGLQANNHCRFPRISLAGNAVAFMSTATNLVPAPTNGDSHVFVRDFISNTTECVSVNSSGEFANNISFLPSISSTGRFVAFGSFGSNLVPNDTNGDQDVFVHDRLLATTERVSVSSEGIQGNAASRNPTLSTDGRYVFFDSLATNLVAGDNNGVRDIFRHDRETGITARVNVGPGGVEADLQAFSPASAGTDVVAYSSAATNLVPGGSSAQQVFVRRPGLMPIAGVAPAPTGPLGLESPRFLVLSAQASAPVEVTHPLQLDATHPSPLELTIGLEPSSEWISVSPSTARLNPGETLDLTMEFVPGGMSPGPYFATVNLWATDRPDGQPLHRVPLELRVRD